VLEEAAQQLDERQDQLGEALLDALDIGVDAAREGAADVLQLGGELGEIAGIAEELVLS